MLRGVAGGDPPTKADIRACEKRRLSRADSAVGRRVHLPAAVLLLLSQSSSVIKNIQN